jgi:hypothetical protein
MHPADLIPYARNAKKHDESQVLQIAGSIKEFGFNNPVLIDQDNGIIAGHGRVMAALKLGLESVPVIRLSHLTDVQRRAYILADNKLAELGGGWDEEMLKVELQDIKESDIDHLLTGFTDEEFNELLNEENETNTDSDEVPELPKEPVTKRGDLWILGDHRLLCGDSTKSEDVNRLMDESKINLAFTSPPYASQREYDESSGFKPIHPNEFVGWWEPIQSSVKSHMEADGSFFVNIKPACEGISRLLYVFDLVLAMSRKWGWIFAEEFCWERNGIPQRVVRRFKNQFEPVYQFTLSEWKFRPEEVMHESDSVPLPLGKGAGDTNAAKRQGKSGAVDPNEIVEGKAYPGNRLPTFNSTHQALGHSAAFPVGLPSFFIRAYSDNGDNVYEPFCGSGSTLIAAEQLGRKCYGMEISPAYCDVIVKRWETLTGKKAVLAK